MKKTEFEKKYRKCNHSKFHHYQMILQKEKMFDNEKSKSGICTKDNCDCKKFFNDGKADKVVD